MLDLTHDAATRSWVASANREGVDFPLQNLPLGVVGGRAAVAIGDQHLDLHSALDAGLLAVLPPELQAALRQPRLNALFAHGRAGLATLRHALFALLRDGSADAALAATCLRPLSGATPDLPCDIGDYTDFFASLNHARNTFKLFRPGQVFLPNYKYLPIAYHGRSSSLFAAPKNPRRPRGQIRPDPDAAPLFAASRKLDFEVELGFFVGRGNAHGTSVSADDAEAHLAGVCILNDWSARDVQAWESQPLGPFLSKNFFSAVSPWVVTLDALEPFRAAPVARAADDPEPMAYLRSKRNAERGAFAIHIETSLQSAAMRETGVGPVIVSRADFARDVWWTPAQMVAHHTVGGCNLRSGDLLGSGTISGPAPGSEGSLLELTWGGSRPLTLPTGEQRSFLLDGDEVTIAAWCERAGYRRIGLGQCTGRVEPCIGA
ncbi:MAG TPA: fumarylacetoacetase [Burkholderiaceae bacterium]|nr:fumarylacetoacetase [Burkholderiaceae bacterium]